MKQILLIITIICTLCTTVHAADELNALRLTLKEGKGDAVEIAFVANPVVKHNDMGEIIITTDNEEMTFKLADIEKMMFFHNSSASIINAYNDKDGSKQGIFTIDGKQTDSIKAKGIYIINGKKVIVK